MRFSTPNTVPSEVVMPMAVLPSLMASREYSTWKRRPSGEKVLIPRSAPHQSYAISPDSRADLPYSERAMNMVSDFGRLFQAQKNFSRGMRLRVPTRRRGGGRGRLEGGERTVRVDIINVLYRSTGRAPVRTPRDLPPLPKRQIGTLPPLIAGWRAAPRKLRGA